MNRAPPLTVQRRPSDAVGVRWLRGGREQGRRANLRAVTTSGRRPIEPPPTGWQFPPVEGDPPDDLIAIGADLAPGTLLAAYRAGYFPMPIDHPADIGWWSPDPRGVIEVDTFRPSRSLRRSCRRFEIRVDTACDEVIDACADARRPHGWISTEIRDAYLELHHLGWVHSIEAWTADGALAGGLYGVSIGSFFAGESMFHRRTDASKVALAAVVRRLGRAPAALLDVQWLTPHLASLGATELGRTTYLERLDRAIHQPALDWTDLG